MGDEHADRPQDEREHRDLEDAAKEGPLVERGTSKAASGADKTGETYEERDRREGEEA